MKEVIILGLGDTREQCPYYNDGKEVWSVNDAYEHVKVERIDKLFVVDKITSDEFHLEKLSSIPCIVSSIPYPEHPDWNVEVYPIGEVLNKFQTKFFTNAICYMVAYALLKGYQRIYFYGIDMMTTSSYIIERGGVEYWMGLAKGLGVDIINPENSATGKTLDGKMYGWWGREEKVALPEDLAEIVRELAPTLPGIKDESEEWVEGEDGNWVRKEQRIIRLGGRKNVARTQNDRGIKT